MNTTDATQTITSEPRESRARGGVDLAPKAGKGVILRAGRSAIWRYGISVCFVGAALAASLPLQRFFPYPFLFLFFAAVIASAWVGGTSVGLFSVLVSTLVVDYFFVPPFHSFAVNATDSAYFIGFVACAVIASWVASAKRKSEEELREARDQLEIRVAERTAELEKSNADLMKTMRDHDEAQVALRQTQSQLAHLARALTMGELTSSIAHEMNQPLAAVVTHGHACLEWLSTDPPDYARARQTVESIIRDGTRAGNVLARIRALFSKQEQTRDSVDINEVISELIIFLRDETSRQGVQVKTELAPNLPLIKGDRVQLQQVVLNLMMNAIDAMHGAKNRQKHLVIRTWQQSDSEIAVSVEDSGVGLSQEILTKIFDPFFTTKAQGIGMGLPISRTIIEAHAGKLVGGPRANGGAVFQFTLPLNDARENG
jgi:C4-dicarboxylate-specific signal transduction histidine kinase